jgi:heme exporter protein B
MTALCTLLVKDFRLMWSAKRILVATSAFAFLLVIVASFSFLKIGYSQEDLRNLTPGIIWLIYLFASVIALNHSLVLEEEDDAMISLVMQSTEPAWVYLAKCLSNFVFLAFVQLLVLVAHGVFFGVNYFTLLPELLAVSLLGGLGISAAGTLFASMAVCTSGRDIVLPLILFPILLVPVAGSVSLFRVLLEGSGSIAGNFWLQLLIGFDVIVLVLGSVLFEFIVRE